MTGIAISVLAVALLTDADLRPADTGLVARIAAEANEGFRAKPRAEGGGESGEGRKGMRIRSRRGDFDRTEGVFMFEGGVFVEYDRDYTLSSDRLFVFMRGTNELNRIVAVGGVTITNDVRVGSCDVATFRNRTREIEMLSGEGRVARLVDGQGGDSLEGAKVKFWIDTEQVVVERSAIGSKGLGGGVVK